MDTITVGQPRIEKASHRPNLQFDILPTVTFVTIAVQAQSVAPSLRVRRYSAVRREH
jgi:hypothetical protein